MDDEALKEFLVESHENLDQLDRDFVALEADPSARERIAGIFRAIHTLKGTSGFFGFAKLEALAHSGEGALSRLRDGQLTLTAELTSALLAMVDRVRAMLKDVELTGTEKDQLFDDVVEELRAAEALQAPGALRPSVDVLRQATAAAAQAAPPRDPSADIAPQLLVPPPAPQPSHRPMVSLMPSITSASGKLVSVHAPALQSFRPPAPLASIAAKPPAEEPAGQQGTIADSNVRVDVGLLDKLMNLVGELVLARNQVLQFSSHLEDPAFAGTSQRLNHITSELQQHVMKTRMQPIGNLWNKLPRVVRDLAASCHKQVRIEMDGKDTELDRTIIEAIKDPLTHIVRNSIDHGIESPDVRAAKGKPRTGTLSMRAFHESGQVNIEFSDDGAGIDAAAVRRKAVERGLLTPERAARMTDSEVAPLVFAPGFSTAAQVTNVSGRGVGMDVVKTNVERIGGTVDLASVPGVGTSIKLKIPLTLAIVPALIVVAGGQRFAIPQVSLLELVHLEATQVDKGIERVRGAPIYRLRGRLLPLVFLADSLGVTRSEADEAGVPRGENLVILQADDRQFGLVVDEINDTEEIVVKPLGKELKGLTVFAGATIMGDGRVALILDVIGLAQHSHAMSPVRDRIFADGSARDEAAADGDTKREHQALLMFGVAGDSTMAVPLAMVSRLEEFPKSRVEHAGGHPVIQYRGKILPLVDLAARLGFAPSATAGGDGVVRVIVHTDAGRSVGFVVDDILDIVETDVALQEGTSRPGVLGAAIVQGRVTEMLDVQALLMDHDRHLLGGKAA